jgi:hypothetical protein
MRYRLRMLLIVLALGPPALAGALWLMAYSPPRRAVEPSRRQQEWLNQHPEFAAKLQVQPAPQPATLNEP